MSSWQWAVGSWQWAQRGRKIVMKIGIVLVMVVLGWSPLIAEELGSVSAGPDGAGGVRAEAAVDLAAVSRNKAVKDAAWYAKPFVAAREVSSKAVDAVKQNPGKTALAVVTGVLGYRAYEGKLEDDWKRLWGGSTTGGKSAGGDLVGDETGTGIVINNEVQGNGNVINQDIVIQAPQGDGTGMAGVRAE